MRLWDSFLVTMKSHAKKRSRKAHRFRLTDRPTFLDWLVVSSTETNLSSRSGAGCLLQLL